MAVNLGFPPGHSLDVALVFNPSTRFVSPQYNLVFDDDFSTLEFVRKQAHPPHWSTLVCEVLQLATDNFFLVDPATWTVSSPSFEDHVPCVPSALSVVV